MKIEDGILIEERELAEKLQRSGAYLLEQKLLLLYEALYFSEKGVLPLEKEKILKALKKRDKQAEIKYRVIKFLWDRGYITRESLDSKEYFRIHRKGFRAGEDRTEDVMRVIKEGDKYDKKIMEKDLEIAGKFRKQFVLAVVGEDIQFIKISRSRFD